MQDQKWPPPISSASPQIPLLDYGANCPLSSHVHPASATHVPRKRQDFQNTVAVKLESGIAVSPTPAHTSRTPDAAK